MGILMNVCAVPTVVTLNSKLVRLISIEMESVSCLCINVHCNYWNCTWRVANICCIFQQLLQVIVIILVYIICSPKNMTFSVLLKYYDSIFMPL